MMMAIASAQSKSLSSPAQVTVPSARVTKTVELLGMALELVGSSDFSLFSSPQDSVTPPPLDEISIYSCAETDDSSTCSTVSLDDEGVNSSPASPRSIFQCYWDKHERRPSCLPSSSQDSTSGTNSKNSYEGMVSARGQAERPKADSCRRRRRIFSDVGCSPETTLPVPEEVQSLVSSLRLRERIVRKAHSVPGLVSHPGASCLRKRGIPERRRSDSSVTFSDSVDVVYFERPKENWASDGWSKFFAF